MLQFLLLEFFIYIVNSPSDALKSDAPIIHENLGQYKHAVQDIYTEPNTNIADRIKIRKGNMTKGWAESQVVIEASYTLPKSDHIAMETRNARAEIHADGQVIISSSTQAPFSVKKFISKYFAVEEGKITVKTPLVGGGFGGKAPVQLEILAYMASKAVGGKEDLIVAQEKVYLRQDPSIYISFKDLVHGFKYPNGNAIEGQVLGRGSFIMSHITDLVKETGKGKPGPAWSAGAQAVEVEFDTKEFTYRIIKAATVIDAGKVLNPKTARGLVTGGMCMGLGLGSREAFSYNSYGNVLTTSLRTYKVMHIGEEPMYLVYFVETPQQDAPFAARGIAEHGIIGMPAALANALSSAAQVDLNQLPLIPEYIWMTKTGGTV